MFKLNSRKLALVAIDGITIVLSAALALLLLTQMGVIGLKVTDIYMSVIVFMLVSLACMFGCKVYVNIWRFAQISDFIKCFSGLTAGFAISYVICDILPIISSHLLLTFSYLIALCGIVVLRTGYSWLYGFMRRNTSPDKIPTLIVGAGIAAHRMIAEMTRQSRIWQSEELRF